MAQRRTGMRSRVLSGAGGLHGGRSLPARQPAIRPEHQVTGPDDVKRVAYSVSLIARISPEALFEELVDLGVPLVRAGGVGDEETFNQALRGG